MRGLLGRDGVDGALLLEPARSVHTMRHAVRHRRRLLRRDLRVLRVVTMAPNRLGMPVVKARSVIEAEAGSFERWGVSVGDRLEIKGGDGAGGDGAGR